MTENSIRKLKPTDINLARQMLRLFNEAFEKADAATPAPAYLERLLARPEFHAVVALHAGRVIGGLTAYELPMLTREERELFVYDVAVDAAHRRAGVGRALIEFAREMCAQSGITALYVAAMADEPGAVRFYEACGLLREDVAWFTHEFPNTRL
jgi:aminoglycoside 3-N-acetyltransferase I